MKRPPKGEDYPYFDLKNKAINHNHEVDSVKEYKGIYLFYDSRNPDDEGQVVLDKKTGFRCMLSEYTENDDPVELDFETGEVK